MLNLLVMVIHQIIWKILSKSLDHEIQVMLTYTCIYFEVKV